MWKKLISLNLALVMVVSLIPLSPVTAFAASDTGYAVFHKNDGSGETVTETMKNFGSNGSLELYCRMPDFTGEDEVIISYNSEADGSGTEYPLNEHTYDIYSNDADNPAQLYAQWEDVADYSIRYITTNGVSSDGEIVVTEGGFSDTAVLAGSNTFTAEEDDEEVIGWSTKWSYAERDRYYEGYVFMPGEEISITENMTLFSLMGYKSIVYYEEKYNSSTGEYSLTTGEPVFYDKGELLSNGSGSITGKIFLGWNSKEDGSGDKYFARQEVSKEMPNQLYAQYADVPTEDYAVLNYGTHGTEGEYATEVILLEDGVADLPDEMPDGSKIVYWRGYGYDPEDDYDLEEKSLYYPPGEASDIPRGLLLRAVTVDTERGLAALIDGDGGQTADGSRYIGIYNDFTSGLGLSQFQELTPFEKENSVLIGYEGSKTKTVYDMDDDFFDSVEIEMNTDRAAYFVAKYLTAVGNYIQYYGNGGETEDGLGFYLQDELTWGSEETIMENPFIPPDGEYFLGWQDEEEEWYMPGTAIPFMENTKLFAQWGENRVTYHYKNWAGRDAVRTRLNMEEFSGYMSSKPEGCLFEGWMTEAGQWYAPNQKIPDGLSVELYESWIEIPTEGNYYILTGTRLSDGRYTQIVPMTATEEEITLPDVDIMGWRIVGDDGDIEERGFRDEQTQLRDPGAKVTVTAGTEIRAMDPGLQAKYYKNYGDSEEVRTYYTTISYASSLNMNLHDPAEIFEELPEGMALEEWNTEADGSGDSYDIGDWISEGIYQFFAQWLGGTWSLSGSKLTIYNESVMPKAGKPTAVEWSDEIRYLRELEFANGISKINAGAFANYGYLRTVTIPASITSIGDGAFKNCSNLEEVIFRGTSAQWAEIDFGENNENLLNARITFLSSDGTEEGGMCGEAVRWALKDGVLTIGGTGAMDDYEYRGDAPWADFEEEIEKLVVQEGVTTIGNCAFRSYDNLAEVILADGLQSIGDEAFQRCYALTSVVLPEGLQTVGDMAFQYCDALISVTFPTSLTDIGEEAFAECDALEQIVVTEGNPVYHSGNGSNVLVETETGKLVLGCKNSTIPDGVTEIAPYALQYVEAETLEIPESVVNIGEYAFYNNRNIKAVYMTSETETIGKSAFGYCYNLKKVYYYGTEEDWNAMSIEDNNDYLISAGRKYLQEGDAYADMTWKVEDGVLTISGEGMMQDYTSAQAPWYSYRESITSVVVEEGITSIGDYAFYDLEYMTDVSLPESLKYIGASAFLYCYDLQSIFIPANVVRIEESAFRYNNLAEITVDVGNTVYDSRNDCNMIMETATDKLLVGCKNTVIPDDTVVIGAYSLTEMDGDMIEVPNQVTTIEKYAFYNSDLTAIVLPNTLTTIGEYAFSGAWDLEDVYYYGTAKDWAKIEIGSSNSYLTNADRHYLKAGEIVGMTWKVENGVLTISGAGAMEDYSSGDAPWYDQREFIVKVVVEEGITSVGKYAFYYLENVTEASLPSSITEIRYRAFYECSALTEIVIPEGVTSISDYAFGYSGLTNITLPNSLTEIEQRVFRNCSALTDVYYYGSEAEWAEVEIDDYYNEYLIAATIHYLTPIEGNVSIREDGADIIITNVPKDSVLVIARYAGDQMKGIEMITIAESAYTYRTELPDAAAGTELRLFLTDEGRRPLCKSLEVEY